MWIITTVTCPCGKRSRVILRLDTVQGLNAFECEECGEMTAKQAEVGQILDAGTEFFADVASDDAMDELRARRSES